jgi:hypothetical protein
MTLEWSSAGGRGLTHTDTWVNGILSRGTSRCKDLLNVCMAHSDSMKLLCLFKNVDTFLFSFWFGDYVIAK